MSEPENVGTSGLCECGCGQRTESPGVTEKPQVWCLGCGAGVNGPDHRPAPFLDPACPLCRKHGRLKEKG